MDLTEIGKAIRERREFMKLKQEDLAEISHVAIKTIYAIELGKANPSTQTLMKLLSVLGMKITVEVIKSEYI